MAQLELKGAEHGQLAVPPISEGRKTGMGTHRCVMPFSRAQKTGWGRGSRPPAFLPLPPASVLMCFAFSPCTKTASRAQHSVLAFPSSLVTTASEETYCFCRALMELTSCFLISCRQGGAGLGCRVREKGSDGDTICKHASNRGASNWDAELQDMGTLGCKQLGWWAASNWDPNLQATRMLSCKQWDAGLQTTRTLSCKGCWAASNWDTGLQAMGKASCKQLGCWAEGLGMLSCKQLGHWDASNEEAELQAVGTLGCKQPGCTAAGNWDAGLQAMGMPSCHAHPEAPSSSCPIHVLCRCCQ